MERFIKAGRISAYNMRMLTENIRIPAMIVIVFLFIVQNLSSVLLFSKSVDIPVTPYGFVFLVNDFTCQFVMIAGAVVIFSNAPFENDGHSYMLFRAGRLPWALGQVIYIFKMSTLYISSLAAATIIPFIGNLTFRAEWGKIWGTLAKTDEGSRFGLIFSIPESIIREYAPANVLLISILLEWACVVWLGLLIYFGNKITGKSLGTIVFYCGQMQSICSGKRAVKSQEKRRRHLRQVLGRRSVNEKKQYFSGSDTRTTIPRDTRAIYKLGEKND